MEHREDTTLTYVWTALAALWLSIFPLWQEGTYSSITRAKWEGTLLFTAVTLGVGLFAALYGLIRHRRLPFRFCKEQAMALVLFLLMGLSACFGAYAQQVNKNGQLCVWMGSLRYEGMATQLCYMAIFLVMSLHPIRKDWLLHLCALSLMLQCILVVLQYLDLNPLGLFPGSLSTRTNYEFQGTIGNIDMVSGYLSLILPLLLGSFILTRKGGWLWLAAGGFGTLWMMCMEVQSSLIALGVFGCLIVAAMLWKPALRGRGTLVLGLLLFCYALRKCIAFPWLDEVENLTLRLPGMAATVLLLLGLMLILAGIRFMRPHKPLFTLNGKQTVLLLLGIVVMGVVILLALPLTEEWGGLWEIREVLLGRGQDSFGSYRLGVWRQTIALSREHLLLGNGPDTFWFAFREHLQKVGVSFPESFDNPHNEYLALLVNDGLPALLCYLLLLGCTLRKCRKNPRQWALLAGLTAYGVQGIFSFSICIVAPMFWAALGMGAGGDEQLSQT